MAQFGRWDPSDYAEEYYERQKREAAPDLTDEERDMESLEACAPEEWEPVWIDAEIGEMMVPV